MMSIVHVLPIDDSAPHQEEGTDCPCGVTTEPVKNPETGAVGWLITHNAFDGREKHEGSNDGIQDKPWPKADAYAIYSRWVTERSRSGKSVWEAIQAAYEAGRARVQNADSAPNPGGGA